MAVKFLLMFLSMGGFGKIGFGKITKELWKKEFLKVVKFLKIDNYDISYFSDEKILKLDTIPQAELIDIIELKSKVSLSKIKPTIVAIPTVFFSSSGSYCIIQGCNYSTQGQTTIFRFCSKNGNII